MTILLAVLAVVGLVLTGLVAATAPASAATRSASTTAPATVTAPTLAELQAQAAAAKTQAAAAKSRSAADTAALAAAVRAQTTAEAAAARAGTAADRAAATAQTRPTAAATAAAATAARVRVLADAAAATAKTATAGASATAQASAQAATDAAAASAAAATAVTDAKAAAAAARTPRTVVSLTFDDGDADQMAAATTLQQNGLTGTFYIISGYVGADGYMSRSDLQTLAAAGNEIGGHTVTHPDLVDLSTAEVQRQACLSRTTLSSWGYTVRSFAYPFADVNASVEQAVAGCGYSSARGLGDTRTRFGCAGCVAAETIPPADPSRTRAPDEVESTWTLKDMQDVVTNARAKGGWVQLTFHHVGDTAADPTTTPALFSQFASWLKTYTATPANNTTVQTVGDVVGGAAKPLVQASFPAPAAAGVNAIQNPSLETAGATTPSCWMQGGYGANTPAFSTTTPGHTGSVAASLSMANHQDGDAKWLTTFDLGECAPTVVTGHTYDLRTWYTSTTATQYAVYLRDGDGSWHYWTSSPWFGAASTYTQAAWTSDAIPAGYTGISFGLNLFSNGTLTTDDAAMYDSVGAPAIAPVAVTAPETDAPAAAEQVPAVSADDPAGTGSDLAQ
ncbi:hypothetical protein ASF23_14855 [Curtobacterium sp. Leaf261]|nr:hypothetical protein ASF23_14855 [Curtobacterium sp. Leaf261]